MLFGEAEHHTYGKEEKEVCCTDRKYSHRCDHDQASSVPHRLGLCGSKSSGKSQYTYGITDPQITPVISLRANFADRNEHSGIIPPL